MKGRIARLWVSVHFVVACSGVIGTFEVSCLAMEREPRVSQDTVLSVLASKYETILYVERPGSLKSADSRTPPDDRVSPHGQDNGAALDLHSHMWETMNLFTDELFGNSWDSATVDCMMIGARRFIVRREVGGAARFEACQLLCFRDSWPQALQDVLDRHGTPVQLQEAASLLSIRTESGKLYVVLAAPFMFITRELNEAEELIGGISKKAIAPLDKFVGPDFVQYKSAVWGVRRPIRSRTQDGKEERSRDIEALSASLNAHGRPAIELKAAALNDKAKATLRAAVEDLTGHDVVVRSTTPKVVESTLEIDNNVAGGLNGNTGSMLIQSLLGFEVFP